MVSGKTQKPNLARKSDFSTEDPFEERIQQEVEEFLRDLTLEFPFPEIFEILRRHEFRDRFGPKVMPLPQKRVELATLKEIHERIDQFLMSLKDTFGSKYSECIQKSFRYYTETTLD